MEDQLAEYALEMESRFYGLTIRDLRSIAFQLAERNNLPHPFNRTMMMAGLDWVHGFLKRHPKLSIRQPEATSMARAAAFNKVNVEKFFKLLKTTIEGKNVESTRIYNVDETGITTVQARPSRIVALKGKHQVGCVTSAERGVLVTAVICASSSGHFIPPMLIFPRVRGKAELGEHAPPGTLMQYHPSGWMQMHLFTEWFRHFLKYSRPSIDDPCILILDGHATHTRNLDVIDLARKNHVHMIVLPPHCTHRMQPLDVAVMGPLSTYYSKEVEKYIFNHPGRAITQFQVGELFGNAYLKASTPVNALSGFKKCGIVPFNDEVFVEQDFLAATVTDVQLETADTENSAETMPSTSKEPIPIMVSPKDIRPLPQRKHEPTGRRGRKRGTTEILTSTPVKNRLEAALVQKGKKPRKQLVLDPPQTSTKEEEDAPCLYCHERYGESRAGDGWVMCTKCKKWAHEACAGIEEDDDFTCEFCD